MNRIGVFVDIVNLHSTISTNFKGAKLDYSKYLKRATQDNHLQRAIAYGAQIDGEAIGFITSLKAAGFEPRYKRAIIVDNRPSIRRTPDVRIVLDIVRHIERLDDIWIGTSDPEFEQLLYFIRERGRRAIIFACNIPPELRDAADDWYEISEEDFENR